MIKKMKIWELIKAIHEEKQPNKVIYGDDVYTRDGDDYIKFNTYLFRRIFNNNGDKDAVEIEILATEGVGE